MRSWEKQAIRAHHHAEGRMDVASWHIPAVATAAKDGRLRLESGRIADIGGCRRETPKET
jgi:hypothetical protein